MVVPCQNRRVGIICIILSAFSFAAMAALVRFTDSCGEPISTFQKALFRNAVAFLVALALFVKEARVDRHPFALPPIAWWWLVVRAMGGTIGIFGNFWAISRIPISDACLLNKLSPFFAVVFSFFILHEHVTRRQMMALGGALIGLLFVIKPGLLPISDILPALAGAAGGMGAGLAYTSIRRLALLGVEGRLIVLFFSAFSTLACVPFVFVFHAPMTFAQILVLTGVGVAAACGQFAVTAAYRFAQARDLAVFDYSNVIFSAIFGFVLFSQIPDCFSYIGFSIIVAMAVLVNRKVKPHEA